MGRKLRRADIFFVFYAVLEGVALIFLRRAYLLTVYQTAAAYLAVDAVGFFVLCLGDGSIQRELKSIYLLLWSGLHGVIVLGFLTQGTFYLTLTQINVVQMINLFLGFALFWALYVICGNCGRAVGIGNILIGIIGVTNRYLVRFRGAPFQVSDIKSARTAGNVLQNYDFTPDIYIVLAVADLALWYLLAGRAGAQGTADGGSGKEWIPQRYGLRAAHGDAACEEKRDSQVKEEGDITCGGKGTKQDAMRENAGAGRMALWKGKARRAGTQNTDCDGRAGKGRGLRRLGILEWITTAVVAAGLAALLFGPYEEIYAKTGLFVKDNYLADLLADVKGSVESYPEGYSPERAKEILSEEELERLASEAGAFSPEAGRGSPASEMDGVLPDDGPGSLSSEMDGVLPDNGSGSPESESGEIMPGAGTEKPGAGTEGTVRPNIVVIMNEAFSDLRVLGELETDVPVMEYWDSLRENCIKGWANVSVLGGTTANSEYEFLTSDAVSLYQGSGCIPYNSYMDVEEYPGLVSVLNAQGYETTAFHPYLSSGWNRRQVYRAMQFDNIIFQEDLEEDLDRLRLYTSDSGDYAFLQEWFEEKEAGVPQFFFNVTMQNHGGYTYRGDDFEATVHLAGDASGQFPQAEQYLSLMKASDEALGELLAYFEDYPEPVIVVLFGDHQPQLETEFYTFVTGQDPGSWDVGMRAGQYKTPFLIWHNYETEYREAGDVSVNYLASLLLSDAGLGMSRYQEYLLYQMASLPVVNVVGAKTAEGELYVRGSTEYAERTLDLQILVYHHTVDGGGTELYGLP